MTTPPDDRPSSLTEGVSIPDLIGEPRGEHSVLRRLLWGLGSLVCFVLGIIGWLVPVITGIPFYILGLALLSKAVPPVGRWINRRERRWSLSWRLLLRPKLRKQLRGTSSR